MNHNIHQKFQAFQAKVPTGEYHVDAEALRQARQGVPAGEYHVDAEALRQARQGVPAGEYHVDAEALRQARQGVPAGEYHRDPGQCASEPGEGAVGALAMRRWRRLPMRDPRDQDGGRGNPVCEGPRDPHRNA